MCKQVNKQIINNKNDHLNDRTNGCPNDRMNKQVRASHQILAEKARYQHQV